MPVVLAVTFGVTIFNGPIAPEPLVRVIDVVPVIVAVPVIVPVVDAVNVSTVPDTFPPAFRRIPPVAVLAIRDSVPLAVIELFRVIAVPEAALSVKLKLLPLEIPLPVKA